MQCRCRGWNGGLQDDLSMRFGRGMPSLGIDAILPRHRYLQTGYLRTRVYSCNQAPRIGTAMAFPSSHLRHGEQDELRH